MHINRTNNIDCTLGLVFLFPGNFVPKNFMLCYGRILSIHNNTALYSIIKNKFGGDIHNFNLPKLTAPDGFKYIICTC